MTYKKFRGRGPGAFEKRIGADGIIQLEVNLGLKLIFKSLLFQAKKIGQLNGDLEEQVLRMEDFAPGGSAVFEYGPDAYHAISGRDYLAAKTDLPRVELHTLADFLARDFLVCTHGLMGMHHDGIRKLLILPDGSAIPVSLRHRITIQASKRN